MDTSSDESVTKAAESLKDVTFYAIVNNAGTGIAHGVTAWNIMNTNVYGVKRVCEAFIPKLDQTHGRVAQVGSGGAGGWVSKQPEGSEDAKKLIRWATTWPEVQAIMDKFKDKEGDFPAYGCSKACMTNYTMQIAQQYPHLKINTCSPGFIETAMTKGMGASKTPYDGTIPIWHLLYSDLQGNGRYYGSDCVRSPLHFMRSPGEPVFEGYPEDADPKF